jgi:predicted transposase YdaD
VDRAQLGIPAVLTVVYLAKGDRAAFPAIHRVEGGGLVNEYRFHTIHLWEHADRIRSGELRELAPLLVLCEAKPTERTLREERALILGVDAAQAVRAELFAVAAMVGTRYFPRLLLERLFREEMQMLKEVSFIEEWILEGEARAARSFLLRQLRKRFGELPPEVVARVESADRSRCEEMVERLLDATSLDELGLAGGGGTNAAAAP